MGSIEAIEHEIKKIKSDKVKIKVIHSGVGNVSERDVKIAGATESVTILAFNIAIDSKAEVTRRD